MLALVVLLANLSTPPAAHLGKVGLVVAHYPPYIYDSRKKPGFLVDMVRKALSSQQIETKLYFSSWKRIERRELDKKPLLSFPYLHSAKRAARWHYSKPLIQAPTIIISHKANPVRWQRLEDLKPYIIGLSAGYHYGQDFEDYRVNLKAIQTGTDLENIRRLLNKRIQLFPTDPHVAIDILNNHFDPIQRANIHFEWQPELISEPLHAVCAKSFSLCSHILSKLETGFAQLKKGEEFQAIMRKIRELKH